MKYSTWVALYEVTHCTVLVFRNTVPRNTYYILYLGNLQYNIQEVQANISIIQNIINIKHAGIIITRGPLAVKPVHIFPLKIRKFGLPSLVTLVILIS